ncbi:MAG: bifunctional oligoribonuclease/PAP phosphatase NrnA, partial [Sphingobacteriales bacterium]
MQPISELKTFLETPRKIFITSHAKPDGDALGSALAMYHYLIKKGHTPVVVSPTDYGVYLHWLPGNAAVEVFTEDKPKATQHLEDAELIFCLDFSQQHRVDGMTETLRKATAPKVMIDHHLDPEDFDTYRLWNPNACATAELVYQFIEEMGDAELVDKNIATCIYTGLVTDSGSFRYANVTSTVHTIVAHLLDAGVEHWQVHRRLFDTFTEDRLRFFGYCISEKLEMLPEYRTAFISVTREELRRFNIQTGDTEGLVNFPLSIAEVIFAALIVEREGIIKLSLRSKGDFPANEFSDKYFSGG